MKMSTIAWTGMLVCSFLISGANAQLKQPLSVQPIGFNYNNFQEAAPAAEAVAESAPAAVPAAEHAASAPAPVSAAPAYHEGAPSYSAPGYAAPSCGCAPAAPACGVCAPSCSSSCGGGCGLLSGGCGLLNGGLLSGNNCLSGIIGDCCLGDAWTLSGALHGDCPPAVDIGGWFQFGYHSDQNDLFFDRDDQIQLHQAWLYAEKAATCDSPFGFRADLMYGVDADDTQAFGNPPGEWDYLNGFDHGSYGWAIPQLYGEVALGENVTVKAGHFYTLIGYEVVTAPDNFFYSHAMTMFNSEPFTHTGVLATATLTDQLTAYGGWTLGWDTGFDQLGDGSSWLGGFSYSLSDDAAFTYMSTAGDLGWRGSDAYSHSVVLDTQLTGNLNYVIQSDVLRVRSTGEDNVGLNQYFLYTVNDCLSLGARAEWWKGDVLTGYAPHGGVLPAAGSLSYYAATFGANIKPHANITVRPEFRYDWSPAANYDESYFGVDAYFTF